MRPARFIGRKSRGEKFRIESASDKIVHVALAARGCVSYDSFC